MVGSDPEEATTWLCVTVKILDNACGASYRKIMRFQGIMHYIEGWHGPVSGLIAFRSRYKTPIYGYPVYRFQKGYNKLL